MNRKTRLFAILGAAAILVIALCVAVFGSGDSRLHRIGGAYGAEKSPDAVAVYKDLTVTAGMLDYQKKLNAEADEGLQRDETDREIIDRLITGELQVEEAERLGIAATDEEISQMIADLQETYATYPESAAAIDQFCEGAGMTLEEYWADVERQTYGTISRLKLRNQVDREYCAAHGLEYTRVNQPQEVRDNFSAYLAELLEAHRDEITYYID